MSDLDPCSEHPHRKFPCLHSESYFLFEFEDDGQTEEPSQKYGLKLGAPIAVACVLLAVIIVTAIMKYARHLDQVAVKKKEAAEEKKQTNFQNNIVCKRWLDDKDNEMRQRDEPTEFTMATEQYTHSDSEDSSRDNNFDMVHRLAPEPPSPTGGEDCPECAICSMEFEPGQLIYESNNPLCAHSHHKKCMDNWLKLQNTCPLCNQPFVLQTV